MSESVLFSSLGLPENLLKTLQDIGYETPSPIQAETIPPLLAGRDLLGQAQTGTGKTAAFALPILAKIDISRATPQALVLAPTRELAIQVAEAFQTYARNMPGFHVLPVYGGQGYDTQLRQLKRGCHVIVGTPGRLIDHMRRNTLSLENLAVLVLDEADEMLRMGFQEDVEWILQQVPAKRQIAMFSATMPTEIRRVSQTYLHDPITVKIASATRTAANIRQRFWQGNSQQKLDALTRILEVENFEGMIIFVRTKTATLELAEKLAARGFAAEPMNGDMVQAHREKLVERLKAGKLDILVATDVVARGLDVDRVSHVINYDIPYDAEAYIHRIGRTGRAGREGDAILFVAPRERRMLAVIEKATGQRISPMQMPTASDVNKTRVERFNQRIRDALQSDQLAFYESLLNDLVTNEDLSMSSVAAALAHLVQGKSPLLINEREPEFKPTRATSNEDVFGGSGERTRRDRPQRKDMPGLEPLPLKDFPDIKMQRYLVNVGYDDGIKPANVVGAIANEADLESSYIGHIEIFDRFTVVDLPDGMPKDVLQLLKKTRICGKPSGLKPLESLAELAELGVGSGGNSGNAGSETTRRPPRRADGERKSGDKRFGDKPRGDKPFSDKPRGDKPFRKSPAKDGAAAATKPRRATRKATTES
jgi:ATP-dependent RNA helicase DeaD